MKIAVPSREKRLESLVNNQFGRSQYFIIFDTESLKYEVIDNAAVSMQGGAGIKAAQTIVDSGAKILITSHCGQNAADVLKASGVKIMKAVPTTVINLITFFEDNKLEELTEIHDGHFQGGK